MVERSADAAAFSCHADFRPSRPDKRHGRKIARRCVVGCQSLLVAFLILIVDAHRIDAWASESCGGIIDVGVLASEAYDNNGADRSLEFQKLLFADLTRRTTCQFNLLSKIPRARQWEMYLSGHLPIVSAAIRTPERNAVGWYEKFQEIRNVLLLHKNGADNTDPATILHDPDVMIGIVRSYSLGNYWDALLADPSVSAHTRNLKDMEAIFRMMSHDRIDATITSSGVYPDLLTAFNLTGDVTIIDWPAVESEFSGIYLSKVALSALIAKKIGRAIEAMVADHSIARIYERAFEANGGDSFDFANEPIDFGE